MTNDGDTSSQHTLRLLVIEDKPLDAELVELELRRAGMRVEMARVDTREGLLARLREPFELAICDYTLPQLDGIEALRLIRQRRPDLLVIMVSGTFGEDAAVHAMREGAVDYLTKNQLSRLARSVAHAIEQQRAASERKRLEDERARIEVRLAQSQKLESLGMLAGGIAHDFNNLLTAVLGFSDEALSKLDGEHPARESLRFVIGAAERAAALTHQLLAYAGRGRTEREPLDLSAQVREIAELITSATSKKVSLELELGSNLPLVDFDPAQLQQLAMNLVMNAAESYGENAGSVRVVTRIRELERMPPLGAAGTDLRPGRYVELEVEDSGCGMPREVLDRIFDPFFTTKAKGRGLGLSAILGIVRSHGGDLFVDSAPGVGTRFRVLLPISAGGKSKARRSDATDVRGHGLVLVADDEPLVLEQARRSIASLGYQVLTATGGAEAIEIFRARHHEIAAVVLDLSMPDLSGEEVFAQLRRIRPDVVALLSSGWADGEQHARFEASGWRGFIAKPYSRNQLGAKLREALVPRGPETR